MAPLRVCCYTNVIIINLLPIIIIIIITIIYYNYSWQGAACIKTSSP